MSDRKATDVLLEIEGKVNAIFDVLRAQDFNIKILSNKLNELSSKLDKQQSSSKITVEAINNPPKLQPMPQSPMDPERDVFISADNKIPETSSPLGFRRNSRPETYAGDGSYLPKQEKAKVNKEPKMKPPPGREATTVVPNQNTVQKNEEVVFPEVSSAPVQQAGNIAVQQRITHSDGSAIFLADVEVINKKSGETVRKTRTNGTGKWDAALSVGEYKVLITKREGVSKSKVEASQDIRVDGSQSPLILPVLIIK